MTPGSIFSHGGYASPLPIPPLSDRSFTMNAIKPDHYSIITGQIIAALEQSTAPWVKPWATTAGTSAPTNLSTGKAYRGINFLLLSMSSFGSPSRCNRNLNNRFVDSAYAREELVAELGAAFLCAALGIDGQLQHAEYIAPWLQVLKSDKRAVMVAAGQTQKAADYVLGTTFVAEEEAA